MSDSDYLQSGGISSDFSSTGKRLTMRAPQKKEDLYLKGYGRQFGEKMTYSLGLSYGLGILAGGTYGFCHGLYRGGSTTKLRLNSILNSCSSKGPALANQAAIMTMFYVGFNNFFGWIRGEEDIYNSSAAGAVAGALYKSSSGMANVAKYSALGGLVFTSLDYAFRHELI
jgi:import inner membrane translocase subunit TIM23